MLVKAWTCLVQVGMMATSSIQVLLLPLLLLPAQVLLPLQFVLNMLCKVCVDNLKDGLRFAMHIVPYCRRLLHHVWHMSLVAAKA